MLWRYWLARSRKLAAENERLRTLLRNNILRGFDLIESFDAVVVERDTARTERDQARLEAIQHEVAEKDWMRIAEKAVRS
jgi:hypothetical protein